MKIFVTYDIDETGGGRKPVIYRVARELSIRGNLISWEIGEFKIRGIEDVFGVKIKYQATPEGPLKEEIVEASRYAQNVRVSIDSVPKDYQPVLGNAA